MLTPQLGAEVVINWAAAANELSKMLLADLTSGKRKIRNFDQMVTLFNVLANFVTPETLEAAKSFIGLDFSREEADETEPNGTAP